MPEEKPQWQGAEDAAKVSAEMANIMSMRGQDLGRASVYRTVELAFRDLARRMFTNVNHLRPEEIKLYRAITGQKDPNDLISGPEVHGE